MPWNVRKGGGARPWKITKHGKVVGSSTSKARAEASVRARLAAEHGAKTRGGGRTRKR